MDIFILL